MVGVGWAPISLSMSCAAEFIWQSLEDVGSLSLESLYPNLRNPGFPEKSRSSRSGFPVGGSVGGYWAKFRKQQCKSWMRLPLLKSKAVRFRFLKSADCSHCVKSSDLIKHLISGGLWRPYSGFISAERHHHQCSSWRTWSSKISHERQRFTKRCLNEDVYFSCCYPECSPKMLPNLI